MSPCTIPASLVPKKDKSLHICVDNRRIKYITLKYRFPILTFRDLLDQLDDAWVFLKIDLCCGYHQTRIRPRDKWKKSV